MTVSRALNSFPHVCAVCICNPDYLTYLEGRQSDYFFVRVGSVRTSAQCLQGEQNGKYETASNARFNVAHLDKEIAASASTNDNPSDIAT